MSLLDKLPSVNKCCCCIPLRWGTIFIAIFGMIFVFPSVVRTKNKCLKVDESISTFTDVIFGVFLFFEIIIVILSIILLIGTCLGKIVTATWYLIGVIACLLVYNGALIALLVIRFLVANCKLLPALMTLVEIILNIAVWTYFIIVVKSYREEMD